MIPDGLEWRKGHKNHPQGFQELPPQETARTNDHTRHFFKIEGGYFYSAKQELSHTG